MGIFFEQFVIMLIFSRPNAQLLHLIQDIKLVHAQVIFCDNHF